MTKLKYAGALIVVGLSYVALRELQHRRAEDCRAAAARVQTLAALDERKDAERWSQFYGVAGCFFLFAALLALSTSGGWAVLACIGAALTCFGTAVSYLLPYSLRGMEAASRALVL